MSVTLRSAVSAPIPIFAGEASPEPFRQRWQKKLSREAKSPISTPTPKILRPSVFMNHLGFKSDARCMPPFSCACNPGNLDLVFSQGCRFALVSRRSLTEPYEQVMGRRPSPRIYRGGLTRARLLKVVELVHAERKSEWFYSASQGPSDSFIG